MMKTIKYFYIGVVGLLLTVFMSCESNSDKSGNGKAPVVTYVRICDAAKSDSLLDGAYLGTRIAIIGENFAGVNKILFNDQTATLNPTYITANTIIVDVPTTIPNLVTNTVTIKTDDGLSTVYTFKTLVPAPSLDKMKCEYVSDGDTATIYGSFIINDPSVPLTVNMYGNVEAKVVEYDLNHVSFVVPQGSAPGQISVKTLYGTTRSTFKFRDKTGLITDFHNASWGNPWGKGNYSDVNGCDGMYALFKSSQAKAWNWDEKLMAMYWAPEANGNTPVATGDYTKLALRFEANVITWTDLTMCIWFETYQDGINIDGTSAQYHWKPYLSDGKQFTYKTDGWETITIPLTKFKTSKDEKTERAIDDISKYTNIDFFMFNGLFDATGAYPIHVCIDNPRIVKL